MTRRFPILLLLLAALGLGVAACGGSDGEPVAGEGENAEVEPTPTPAAEVSSLTGRDTTVAWDSGFLDALEQLEVTPGAVGTAKVDEQEAVFPITGGHVEYFGPDSGVMPYVQGRIEHNDSGISLTAGGKTVDLQNLTINPATSTLTGEVVLDGESVQPDNTPLFFLDGRTLENPPELDEAAGTVTLTGTTVELKQEAADLLNSTFGIDDLAGGLEVGTATITANLQPEFGAGSD